MCPTPEQMAINSALSRTKFMALCCTVLLNKNLALEALLWQWRNNFAALGTPVHHHPPSNFAGGGGFAGRGLFNLPLALGLRCAVAQNGEFRTEKHRLRLHPPPHIPLAIARGGYDCCPCPPPSTFPGPTQSSWRTNGSDLLASKGHKWQVAGGGRGGGCPIKAE